MVRTETSNSLASASAVIRPRACKSNRIDNSRLARISAAYQKYLTRADRYGGVQPGQAIAEAVTGLAQIWHKVLKYRHYLLYRR